MDCGERFAAVKRSRSDLCYAVWNIDLDERFTVCESAVANGCHTVWNMNRSDGFARCKCLRSDFCHAVWNHNFCESSKIFFQNAVFDFKFDVGKGHLEKTRSEIFCLTGVKRFRGKQLSIKTGGIGKFILFDHLRIRCYKPESEGQFSFFQIDQQCLFVQIIACKR